VVATVLAVLLGAGLACADRSAREGSSGNAAGTLPRWSLAPKADLTIGGGDGDEALYRVMDAVRLPDGRVAILNAGAHQVRVVAPDGRTLQAFGREGSGPGEFRAPTWIGMRGDTAVVADVRNSRLSRFLSDGTFVGSAPLDRAAGLFPQVVGQYGDGRLLVAADEDALTSRPGVVRGRTSLLRLRSDGTLIDTLAVVPASEQVVSRSADGRGIRIESLPFGRRTVLAMREDVVFVGTGETQAIQVIRADGRPRDLLRVPGSPRPVTASDVEDYWKNLVSDRSGADARDRALPEGTSYPRTLPPYGDLHVDGAGRVWVGESRLPREWDSPARYWIFSPGGRPVGELRVPPRSLILDAGADWVLLRQMDAEQRELVCLYRIAETT
jgi:hypothetical protein